MSLFIDFLIGYCSVATILGNDIHLTGCSVHRKTFLLSIAARRNFVKRIAGENLYINLDGIDLADATLQFSGEAGNFTLVR